MNARIEHVALWARDLDALAAFYARWFGARWVSATRIRARDLLRASCEFGGGARLEVMTRIDIGARAAGEQLGLAHIAISVGDEAAVDALAARLVADGVARDRRAAAHGRRLLRMRGARSGRQSRGNRGRLHHEKDMRAVAVDALRCWLRGRSARCGPTPRRPPGPGRVGGGRPAPSSARSCRAKSKRWRPLASAASRSRLSTARAVTKSARSSSCRRAGSRCSSTPRAEAKRRRDGRRHGDRHGLALRRSGGECCAGLEHGGARKWPP